MTSGASAPGKVILFGEHFVVHGTRAVLAAIDRRVTVVSERVSRPGTEIISDLGSCRIVPGGEAGISELRPFGFLAERILGEFGHDGGGEGIRIEIRSDLPHGVGLGSSSAACVAAAASISGLFTRLARDEVCRLAIEAEKTIFGNTSGADCTVCTHGGVILYGRDSGFERMGPEPGFDVIVADSGVIHSTAEEAARVSGFRRANPEEFGDMCRKESQLIEGAISDMEDGDLRAVGEAMRENQGYLRRVGVSNGTLERIIGIADPGSYGSKITGAGGGGCVISVVGRDAVEGTLRNLRENGIRCFAARIDPSGLETF